jgi:predicted metal-dependent peptidase
MVGYAADTDRDAGDLQVVRSKNAPGGGGTSFVPVFEWIESTM